VYYFLVRDQEVEGQILSTSTPVEVQLGSKRLQLDQGGGATSFLLRDLECRDVNSIPTAPTNLLDSI
jgi:hypothetical protein